MCHRLIRQCIFLAAMACSYLTYADPWFTGPLLAPAGHTVPAGHSVFEPYVFATQSRGAFNNNWNLVHTPLFQNETIDIIFTHGFTDKIDVQFILPYQYNQAKGSSYQHVGDTVFALGYQAIEQKDSLWIPNLRVAIQEVIPSGKFGSLSPINNGTDSTGLGSYQTGIALNFQHLLQLTEINYLRTRLSISYIYAASVNVAGNTIFGGNETTMGTVNPGDQVSADVAFELTLTQHWVGVLEGYFANRSRTTFVGVAGMDPFGNVPTVGQLEVDQITFAPALEYNFNEHVGVIGGYWLSLAGRDTSAFSTGVVAINVYW